MLEAIKIENFQAHEGLQIAFDPGITTIVGPSDTGKSAVIRALRLVCLNQPGGDAFIRHGTDMAVVGLKVDGHTVIRRKGKTKNHYVLDKDKFQAVGRDVPVEIEELLAMGPVCWQAQMDAPYWFSETAGEVGRQLNAIVNLEIIDTTLKKLTTEVNSARTLEEAAKTRLAKAEAELTELEWVEHFCEDLEVVEAADKVVHGRRAAAAACGDLLETAQRHQSSVDRVSGVVSFAPTMLVAGANAAADERRADRLGKLVHGAQNCKEAADVAVPDIVPVSEAVRIANANNEQTDRLRRLIVKIRELQEDIADAETKVKNATNALPELCPTCNQPI